MTRPVRIKGRRRRFDKLGRRMPKRSKVRALDEFVLKHLDFTAPMKSMELYRAIVDDYGTTSMRAFFAVLVRMRKAGSIVMVTQKFHGESATNFYTRAKR